MWAQFVNIAIGLFLMVSPAIWSFDQKASDHHHIIGPMIITVAIIALWEVNRGIRWVNILFGIWLIISPFVLQSKGINAEIDVFAGILLILFSLFKGTITQQYGGGWGSLFQESPEHLTKAESHKE